MNFDLVVEGGTVADGTGSPLVQADVGILSGRIASIGDIPSSAPGTRIVAKDLIVAPGFIDVHTHSDITLLEEGSGVNKVCQGVSTEVTGNCGFSAFPVVRGQEDNLSALLNYLGPDKADMRWCSFADYAARLQSGGPVQNVACLVGHGALRIAVAGLQERALETSEELTLGRLLEESLEQGAFGFSTGLTYVPSMFAPPAELVRLAVIAYRHDAIYATHARARAGHEMAAISEAIEVARASGAQVEYSHLALNDPSSWGQAEAALSLFDDAQRQGVRVAFDVYPYHASASSIAQYLPTWLLSMSEKETLTALARPADRNRALLDLDKGFYGGIPWMWERVILTQATHQEDYDHVGKTLAAIAQGCNISPDEAFLRLYERNGNSAQVALFYRTEEDMVAFLRHPASIVGSDGQALRAGSTQTRLHPRYYGTFPRVLGRYVRDKGQLTLVDAVKKMTGEPAARLGLKKRGYIREGFAADLVAFSAEQITDTATFVQSNTLPVGIQTVIINGTVVVEKGAWNGRAAGEVLLH